MRRVESLKVMKINTLKQLLEYKLGDMPINSLPAPLRKPFI